MAESKAEAATGDYRDGDEDTIYVSVEKATPSSQRVTRARAAQDASDMSQMSQRSSTSSTPGTKKAKGTRRRGRPRKTRQSQASRDTSPLTEVQATAATAGDTGDADVEMLEVQPHVDSPSLGSEVEETAESKVENEHLPEEIVAQIIEQDARQLQVAHAEEENEAEESVNTDSPETSSNEPVGLPISIVANLQNVLDSLNSPTVDGKILEADLATIHSLCFRIGLKAQELAGQI